jgi:hypothetical protein
MHLNGFANVVDLVIAQLRDQFKQLPPQSNFIRYIQANKLVSNFVDMSDSINDSMNDIWDRLQRVRRGPQIWANIKCFFWMMDGKEKLASLSPGMESIKTSLQLIQGCVLIELTKGEANAKAKETMYEGSNTSGDHPL